MKVRWDQDYCNDQQGMWCERDEMNGTYDVMRNRLDLLTCKCSRLIARRTVEIIVFTIQWPC
jgi:hypothetical protein